MDIFLQPQTKTALHFLNTIMRNSYAYPEQINMENVEIKELMNSQKVLCFIGNIANTGVNFRDWVSTGVILADDGNTPVMGKNLRASTGWISTFISKSCENPEAIAAFIDYMTSEEGLTLWNYGYENIDFCIDEDGIINSLLTTKEFEEKNLQIWWMFVNTAWQRSVQNERNEGTESEDAAITAYGSHEMTVILIRRFIRCQRIC